MHVLSAEKSASHYYHVQGCSTMHVLPACAWRSQHHTITMSRVAQPCMSCLLRSQHHTITMSRVAQPCMSCLHVCGEVSITLLPCPGLLNHACPACMCVEKSASHYYHVQGCSTMHVLPACVWRSQHHTITMSRVAQPCMSCLHVYGEVSITLLPCPGDSNFLALVSCYETQ